MASQNVYKLALVLMALVLAGLLLRPFITPLVFAAVLAYLIVPLHKKISEKISVTFSAYFLTTLAIVLVSVILGYGASIILNEFGKAYLFVSKINVNQIAPSAQIADTIKNAARFFFSRMITDMSGLVGKVPQILVSVFIFFASFFYFIKDGEKAAAWVKNNLPFPEENKTHLFNDMKKYFRAFIYVWLLVAAVQGAVAFIGFELFGIPYALLGGAAAIVFSILPVIGTSALYIPVGIFSILKGNTDIGIGLIIYGLVIGGILDNIVRPYLAGKHADAHPLLVLLGVLGGLILLGPAGMIVGPVLLLGATTILKSVNIPAWK